MSLFNKNKSKRLAIIAGLSGLLLSTFLLAINASAFTLLGTQWEGGREIFRAAIFGSPTNAIPGNNFNLAYRQAIEDWNRSSAFQFDINSSPANPCLSNTGNSVAFSNTICGQAFGDSTLAVARTQSFRGSTSRVTIFFNNAIQWNVFSGPINSRAGIDLRRVAIHELGHGLGLDHSNTRSAIMFPSIGNVDSVASNDIAGAAALYDRDNDGVGEAFDNCLGVSNPSQSNVDNDAFGDACDSDADNDGIGVNDNCPLISNTNQSDTDNDGIGDVCDSDIDGDGVSANDNCPLLNNPDQSDVDDDGLGDICDDDADNDGVAANDNCPLLSNPDQSDIDSDGIGDLCDEDADGDNVLAGDNCPAISNPEQTDSDNDGIGNACDPFNDIAFVSAILLLLLGE